MQPDFHPPPCIVHEDDHILVVHKPPGLNTHSPAPHAGEGIYEWLRNSHPRWATLAIIHRLDKTTSGLMIFAKTRLANKSLTDQFAQRKVRKTYLLLTDRPFAEKSFTMRTGISRLGEKYVPTETGDRAETRFHDLGPFQEFHFLAAEPLTGRTHQIRVHAELKGVPILGDTLYGGRPFPRLCLHAHRLLLRHPADGRELDFVVEPDFLANPALLFRKLLIDPQFTSAYRLLHGASDHAPYYLERWGEYLLAQSECPLDSQAVAELRGLQAQFQARAVYHKILSRDVARVSANESAPKLVLGTAAPSAFEIRENGLRFEISFDQGYSVGLFLDQSHNRLRLLRNYVGPGFPLFEGSANLAGKEILNTFAYTCGFSVSAALAGARATSLDLSRKYLEWGARNFRLNGLDPASHDFIYGDVFDWAARLRRKGRLFDLVLLDPPTFSRGKNGAFRAEQDFGSLVTTVLPLLRPGGILFASTNAHKLPAEKFLAQITAAVRSAGRDISRTQFVPQPIDFPASKEEPLYLKTVWLRIT